MGQHLPDRGQASALSASPSAACGCPHRDRASLRSNRSIISDVREYVRLNETGRSKAKCPCISWAVLQVAGIVIRLRR
jgi:hypothetical protein